MIDISIPDELLAEVDRVSKRLGMSRGQLFAAAIHEYLARHDSDSITDALDRVYAEPCEHVDPAVTAAAYHLLERVEWN